MSKPGKLILFGTKPIMNITKKLLQEFGYAYIHNEPDPMTIGTIFEEYLYSYNGKGIRVYFQPNTNNVIIRTALSDGVILYKGEIKEVQLLNTPEFFKALLDARRWGMRFAKNGYDTIERPEDN